MRILVCGGRNYSSYSTVKRALDQYLKVITLVIEGGATGADSLAKEWAKKNFVPFMEIKAEWDDLVTPPVLVKYRDGKPYNAIAGHVRNKKMLTLGKPDLVLAFPGNKGTADMIAQAKKAGVEVIQETSTSKL